MVMIAAMLPLWEVGIQKKTIIIISGVNVVADWCTKLAFFPFFFFCLSFLVSAQLTIWLKHLEMYNIALSQTECGRDQAVQY